MVGGALTGHTEKAETAMEARPAHMRMSLGLGQRNRANRWQHSKPMIIRQRIPDSGTCPMVLLWPASSKILTQQITKGQEKLSSLSGLILIAAKPLKKKKALDT